jgi:hypothetical protein
MSDERVERAAKAHYAKTIEIVAITRPGAPFLRWDELPEEQRRISIAGARAALAAAGPDVHPVVKDSLTTDPAATCKESLQVRCPDAPGENGCASPRGEASDEHSTWQPIETLPKDGRTVAVRAVMRVHHMKGSRFATMPPNWRPDTPVETWRFTAWQEIPADSAMAVREADTRGEASPLSGEKP